MDAIRYHVRSEGRIVKRAVYIALGIDMNGKKDVLGMYVGESKVPNSGFPNGVVMHEDFDRNRTLRNGYGSKEFSGFDMCFGADERE